MATEHAAPPAPRATVDAKTTVHAYDKKQCEEEARPWSRAVFKETASPGCQNAFHQPLRSHRVKAY